MSIYNLAGARVVLFGTDPGQRRILYDVMRGTGFRSLHVVNKLEELRQALVEDEADMLVLDADRDPHDTARLLRDIRFRRLGRDPYLVVSATSWRPQQEAISAFVNAGADDILAMPMAVSKVSGRVDHLIQNRKKFVATASYVGPDRREGQPRNNVQDELGTFVVPNALRFKVTGDPTAVVDLAQINQANKTVDEHRLRRSAIRFVQLATALEEQVGEAEPPALGRSLHPLFELLEVITAQVEVHHDDLLKLVTSMRYVVEDLLKAATPHDKLLVLTRLHGQALLASLRGTDDASRLVVQALHLARAVVGHRMSVSNDIGRRMAEIAAA